MFKEFLTNKWILGGFGCLLIFAAGCFLWLQNELANIQQQEVQHSTEIQQLKQSPVEDPQTEHAVTAQPSTSVKKNVVSKDIADETPDTMSAIESKTQTGTDTLLESASKEIDAEEEQAPETLSAEELRKQEGAKRFKAIFAQLDALSETQGGRLDHTSSPEAKQEALGLMLEMFSVIEEEAEDVPPALRFFINLMRGANTLTNAKGEIIVSEYVKMAEDMEAVGMGDIARGIRSITRSAIARGDEVIKPEDILLPK